MLNNCLRGILFDLDGVLYNADRVIAGAADTVKWVQDRQIPHLFVTNTTSRSRNVLVHKLAALGFNTSHEHILTPAVAAAQWLRDRKTSAVALFVTPSTKEEFAGLDCLPDEAERGASFVVVGDLGEHWDYPTLNRAFRLLHANPEAALIALGMTRYWMTGDGVSLDVAPFVAALEHATGRQATVLGKPDANFFHAACRQLGLPPDQILMIGDDIVTDIGGAQSAGLKGALVQTGKFRPSDLDGPVKPDHIFESMAELPKFWSH